MKNAASVKRTLLIALIDTKNKNFGKQQNTCLFLPLTVEMTVNLLLGGRLVHFVAVIVSYDAHVCFIDTDFTVVIGIDVHFQTDAFSR